MQARFGGPQGVYVTTISRELSTSVACDCGATPAQATHPRYYGSFPRVLGRYVREAKALTWEDAIRKMTALPAATIGMTDRGLLAVGMAADVTVFDPATVIDRATFEQPTLPSEGIRHVLVNGRLALRDGDATGERAGRALKRSTNMPSRPMSSGKRRVTAAASVGSAQVTLDVRQEPSARSARGSFRVKDGAGSFEASEFGVLQATADWASFTARARFSPSGEERAVTVVLDQADPAAPGTPRLVVEAGGQMLLNGSMQGRFNVTSKP
jgi:hypothetical protein